MSKEEAINKEIKKGHSKECPLIDIKTLNYLFKACDT